MMWAVEPRPSPADRDWGKGPKQQPRWPYGRTHPDAVARQAELADGLDDADRWTRGWWRRQELFDWLDAAGIHRPTVTPLGGGTFAARCVCGWETSGRSERDAWRKHSTHVWDTGVYPAFRDRLETFHDGGHCRPPCCGRTTA